MVYDTPMLSHIGVSYTVGKLRVPAFPWTGGHDRVFVSMVAAPMSSGLPTFMQSFWGETQGHPLPKIRGTRFLVGGIEKYRSRAFQRYMTCLSWIGMSYTIRKLLNSTFRYMCKLWENRGTRVCIRVHVMGAPGRPKALGHFFRKKGTAKPHQCILQPR